MARNNDRDRGSRRGAGSTERVAAMGDKPWRELLSEFYRRTREVLQVHRGREISTAGDGFLATFEGPARAIRCDSNSRLS